MPSAKWLEFEDGVISGMFAQSDSAANADGDYAMEKDITKPVPEAAEGKLFDNWCQSASKNSKPIDTLTEF